MTNNYLEKPCYNFRHEKRNLTEKYQIISVEKNWSRRKVKTATGNHRIEKIIT